jgi:hypothetical protein
MPFDVSEFKSNGARFGFLRPAYFMANVARIPGFLSNRGWDPRFLIYLCSAANLPGIAIATSDERRFGYGPTQKIPYDVLHPDVTLTFYCDGDGESVALFDEWLRSVVTYYDPSKTFKGASYGEIQYPTNYMTNLELYAYNESPGVDNPTEILRYTLVDAFPINMSDVQMDWSNDGAVASFQVTFAYRYHTLQKNSAADYLSGLGGIQYDAGWIADIANIGFAVANRNKQVLVQQVESITCGFIGAPDLANAINSILGGNPNIGAITRSLDQLGRQFTFPSF